jgi:hypothetical protein
MKRIEELRWIAIAVISVDPESNPIGPVVPVDAIATLRDGATYGGTGPVRRDLTAVEVACRALPQFVLESEIAMSLTDGTGA